MNKKLHHSVALETWTDHFAVPRVEKPTRTMLRTQAGIHAQARIDHRPGST